ncbi:hypothetical protein DFH09DRAFT_470235 [Mycena vulgaris]|nr:hypothetical protein DFH09DRAFT_470235 [Mycena vulgaris]
MSSMQNQREVATAPAQPAPRRPISPCRWTSVASDGPPRLFNPRLRWLYAFSMAVPPHFTTLDLSGRFILNQTLSDAAPDVLAHQGVANPGPILRGVLSFNHYTGDNGDERIWVEQEIASQGHPKIADEDRALDWRDRAREDPLLGPVVSRIRRVKTHGLEPRFLRMGWTPDTLKYGVLHYRVCNDARKWVAVETWGIEEIEGQRRFCRHIEFSGPDGKDVEAHLVYDYVESL